MRTLILVLLACLIAAPAGAQNPDLLAHFERDTPVQVTFIDNVSDGCLPRPKAIETVMELGLQRAGLRPTKDESFWTLQVTAGGYETTYEGGAGTGDCVVTIAPMFYWYWPLDPRGPKEELWLSVPVISWTGILSGPKSQMQEAVRNAVAEAVDDMANEILKATEKKP